MTGYEFTLEAIVQSFQLLLRYIGVEWFREQADPFERKLTAEELAKHEYLNTRPSHPLINWYLLFPSWKAECEKRGMVSLPPQIVNLAILGQSLYKISRDKKFQKLIARLKQPDDFYATAFEIEVAGIYIMQGLQVEFVEEKDTRTPDLHVTHKSGMSFWVECKNRDTSNDKQSHDTWKQIERNILQYLVARRLNYQVAFVAREELRQTHVSLLNNFVIETIERKFEPQALLRLPGATITLSDKANKFDLTIYKLSELDVKLDSDSFRLPISGDQMDFGTFTCENTELDDGRTIIHNPRAIQFSYANSVRVQSVKNSFKKAVKQLPITGLGVIYIRLPINSWVTDLAETMKQIEHYLRKELSGNDNRRVNAVIVSIYYTELVQSGTFHYPAYKPFRIVVEHTNPLK